MGKKPEQEENWYELGELFETTMAELMVTLGNLDLLVNLPSGGDGEMRLEFFVRATSVFFEAHLKELGHAKYNAESYRRFDKSEQLLWEIIYQRQKHGMKVGNVWQQFFGDWRILPEKARWFNSVMRNVGHATSSPGIERAMHDYYQSERYLFDYSHLVDRFGEKAMKLPEFRRYESQLSDEDRELVKTEIAGLLPEAEVVDLGWLFGGVAHSDLQLMLRIDDKDFDKYRGRMNKCKDKCDQLWGTRSNTYHSFKKFWSCRVNRFDSNGVGREVGIDLWPQVVTDEALERAKEIMADPKRRQELEMRMLKKWDGINGCFFPVTYFS